MKGPVLISAGEKSGENYGAALVKKFHALHPEIEFFGIGGNRMREAGVTLTASIDQMSVGGGVEILSHLPRLFKIYRRLVRTIKIRKPSAAVLIDSPDFNLRLAKKISAFNIPVLYYISPTVWAWRKGRLKTIKKTVSKMMLIFPFEQDIYKRSGIPFMYVGHPLCEVIKPVLSRKDFIEKYRLDPEKKIVSVLPGSRQSEIHYHMPVLKKALRKIRRTYPVQYILLRADSLPSGIYSSHLSSFTPPIPVLSEDHASALKHSTLALSSCGTANLEAALLGTPLIAFYRLSPLSFYVGVHFVKIKTYSIVNILAGRPVIPELIQHRFTASNIVKHFQQLFESKEKRDRMKSRFKRLELILGDKKASENAAYELKAMMEKISRFH